MPENLLTGRQQAPYFSPDCRWGADYLLKTLVYDTAGNGTLTGQIYQVGNLTTDSLFWGRPEDITMSRPYYIASANAMSDLGTTSRWAVRALPYSPLLTSHSRARQTKFICCLAPSYRSDFRLLLSETGHFTKSNDWESAFGISC